LAEESSAIEAMMVRQLLQVEEGAVMRPLMMQPETSGQGQPPVEKAQHLRCRLTASK
jgi:hypothetical protein